MEYFVRRILHFRREQQKFTNDYSPTYISKEYIHTYIHTQSTCIPYNEVWSSLEVHRRTGHPMHGIASKYSAFKMVSPPEAAIVYTVYHEIYMSHNFFANFLNFSKQ